MIDFHFIKFQGYFRASYLTRVFLHIQYSWISTLFETLFCPGFSPLILLVLCNYFFTFIPGLSTLQMLMFLNVIFLCFFVSTFSLCMSPHSFLIITITKNTFPVLPFSLLIYSAVCWTYVFCCLRVSLSNPRLCFPLKLISLHEFLISLSNISRSNRKPGLVHPRSLLSFYPHVVGSQDLMC